MTQDLTVGDIKQNIRSLALPAGLGFLFHTLYNITDTYFAGQISTEALAALSLSFPIFFLILAVAHGMSSAVNSLVSNSLGSKQNRDKTANIAHNVLFFALLLAFIVTIIGLFSIETLLGLLGADGSYLITSKSYIDILVAGSIVFILSMFINSLLNAQGDMVSFRNILIVTFFLNILFDYLAIYYGFGIKGIAYATVTTETVALVYLAYKLHKTSLLKNKFTLNLSIFKELISQGIPPTTNMFFMSLGVFIIYYYVSGFGEHVIAAFGIGMKIEHLALLPIIGIEIAVLTMVSQNNGAKEYERIDETIKLALRYSLYISLLTLVVLWLFAAQVMAIFTNDIQVITEGVLYLKVESFLIYPFGMIFIYVAVLQGIKKQKFIFYLSLVRQIILPVLLLSILMLYTHNILYVWLAIALSVILAALSVSIYTKRALKKNKRV